MSDQGRGESQDLLAAAFLVRKVERKQAVNVPSEVFLNVVDTASHRARCPRTSQTSLRM